VGGPPTGSPPATSSYTTLSSTLSKQQRKALVAALGQAGSGISQHSINELSSLASRNFSVGGVQGGGAGAPGKPCVQGSMGGRSGEIRLFDQSGLCVQG
jgi:hypothetical protein